MADVDTLHRWHRLLREKHPTHSQEIEVMQRVVTEMIEDLLETAEPTPLRARARAKVPTKA